MAKLAQHIKITRTQLLACLVLVVAACLMLLQLPQDANIIRNADLQVNTVWTSVNKDTSNTKEEIVSVCTRLKNEAIYLEEWIEFHLLVGVDHFHIFDDSSTDGTVEVLSPYVKRGLITLAAVEDHSHDADHGQFGHRDQCIAENPSHAKWIIMVGKVLSFMTVVSFLLH